MITSNTVQVQAPAAVVWAVFADVERWPDWTPSVTSVEPLDGPLARDARFAIRQPRLPRLVWRVVDLEPGRSWVWRAGGPGGRTFAHHLVEAQDDGSTLVTQRIDQRGISLLKSGRSHSPSTSGEERCRFARAIMRSISGSSVSFWLKRLYLGL